MNYQLITATLVAKIDDDGISRLSCSTQNPDYLAWLAEGNTPLPAAPVSTIRIATPRQIRQALTAAGLRAGVEAAVAAGDQDLQDWWEFATQFEQNHPMVTGMATQLGVTAQQLDDLFALAVSL